LKKNLNKFPQKQHFPTKYQPALKALMGLAVLWLVSVDSAVASCAPNLSPTADCDELLLDQSNIEISIPSTITVGPNSAPDWAVDIAANTDNIGLTNNGVISGGTRGISIRNTATNISITNVLDAQIITSGGSGISNDGIIRTLTNEGLIASPNYGIINLGEITTLTNTLNAQIVTSAGSGISNDGIIRTLTNDGLIDSPNYGIVNYGEITTVTNGGSIWGQLSAIQNEGRMTSISNTGDLFSGQHGILNAVGGYIGSILNTNSIGADIRFGPGDPFTSGIFNIQSEIGTITNDVGSTILSNSIPSGTIFFPFINSGIANANSVEEGTGENSSIGNIINRGSIEAIGGDIVAGISNGYLPKFSSDPPTTASATNTIQSVTNYGRLYAEGDGFITAGVLNGGYGLLTNPDDRDESYNLIHRIENFSRIEGRSASSVGGFGAGIFNGMINFVGGNSNRDGYVIDELINNSDGIITGSTTDTSTVGVGILNAGVIREIQNAGVIDSSSIGGSTIGIFNVGVIESLNNQATGAIENGIYNVETSIGADPANINNIINSGVIRNTGSNFDPDALPNPGTIASFAIHNFGGAIINNLTNTQTGQIINGIGNSTDSTINYLTNLGEIQAGIGGYGIINAGSIGELNNLQGGSQPLTYSGPLPTNYNIIIYSTSNYGKLEVNSPGLSQTRFGIYGGSLLSNGTYSSVLTGVTRGNLAAVTGTYGSATWSLINSSGTIWDLLISGIVTGPSTAYTQQSMVNTSSVLQGTFTLQNSVMVNGFTYDCSLFDRRGICVSAGGRNTTVQAQGINNTSGLLIASYRLDKNNSRIGAWVDQNLSVSGPGTVQLSNSTPMIGLFGVWSQQPDGVGAEVKVSAAYGQKDTTITRQVVGSGATASEAGSGSSQLISQGAQVVGKYGFAVMTDVIISPYAGVRYTQNNMGGYTEATSSSVTVPLTYSALNTNATTALAGAEARYKGIPKTTLFASAGVETDTNTSAGSYSATGLNSLTPVNFNPNPVKTRPTATVGGYYDIMKNQRIGVTGIYRQEPFQAVSTTTVLATYTIGL
jgi:hypothetical protein